MPEIDIFRLFNQKSMNVVTRMPASERVHCFAVLLIILRNNIAPLMHK
jgi:hypothetical protein